MIIAQIRSGAQTGVDIAALRAAMRRGVPTGGVMSKGFMTTAGPKPEWAEEFGLTEHASKNPRDRTRDNVRDSDLTIRIVKNLRSPGEVCTMRAIVDFKKPHYDIVVRQGWSAEGGSAAVLFIQTVARDLGRPVVVNVAGNSERTCPGIEDFAEYVVLALIDACASG